MEFRQARHHFKYEEQKLRSFFNSFKTLFLFGRQKIQRIIDQQRCSQFGREFTYYYGMILLKQQEFKILDNFISRIEQIQKLIILAMNCSSMSLSGSSSPDPGSIDKSDQIMINQYTNRTNINMGELNGDIIITNSHTLQNPKVNVDSPAPMISNSHIDNNNQQQMHSQNLRKVTINNYPVMQSNYNFKGSQFVMNLQNSNNIDLRSQNRIPPSQNNINHQTQQTQKELFPQQVNSYALTDYNQQARNNQQTNYKSQSAFGQIGQNNLQYQQQDYVVYNSSNSSSSFNNYLIKARFFLHTIMNDIKEYQLSCRELCLPEYKKYRLKWNSRESKYREEFEKDMMMKTQADRNANLKYLQFQQQIQYIQQQAYLIINNQGNQNNFIDSSFVDSVIGSDAQSYSLNLNRKGVYSSIVSQIEDLYQQRTVIVNLRIVLENFAKILSGDEKININLEQFNHVDPDILSNDEKLRLREAYGINIIDESYERIIQYSNLRSQANGACLNQIPCITPTLVPSPLFQKSDKFPFSIQEEDVETFRDMILSIIQSIYSLYKDQSSSINIQVHRLYSKEGELNPLLKHRKKYLNEIIKANIDQWMQQKQINKPNSYGNTNFNGNQQPSNLNQSQINKNYQHNFAPRVNPYKPTIQIPNYKMQNDGKQIMSISNIPYVQSSKISPNKPQKIQPLCYELGEKAQQFQEEQKQNLMQERMNQFQNQNTNQFSEDNNENIQSFNQNNHINFNSQLNFQNTINYNNPQSVNTPISATKKNQILNMPELISQTMSNSNLFNLNGQNGEKSYQFFQQQQQYQANNTPQLNMNQQNQNPQQNNHQYSIWKNYQNEKSIMEQQSLIQSAIQQQQPNNFSQMQFNNVDQSTNLNKDQPENSTINTQYIEELMENGKYRKLRVVRINLEIQQTIINDNYTKEFVKYTDCLSQMDEFISYLSPIPLVYKRSLVDMKVIHQYTFYVENFIYQNNLPENYKSESNQTEQVIQNGDRASIYKQSEIFNKDLYESNQIDLDEHVDIASVENRQKDTKYTQKKKTLTNLDIISEHNQDELNQGSEISRKSQHYIHRFSSKAPQQKDSKFGQKKPTIKANLQIEGNQTPNLSAQNSFGNPDQKSQNNTDQNVEQNSDRRFLKLPQIREQQISFNGKLDGTQSPFYIDQTNQDITQTDFFNRDTTERKNQSFSNSNNCLTINDNSNAGFNDTQNGEDPQPYERRLSDNIVSKTRKEEVTARPHASKSIDQTNQNTQIQNDLEASNMMNTSQHNDEFNSYQQENVRRERELSSEVVINQVRESERYMKNNLAIKNTTPTIKSNRKFQSINTLMSINPSLIHEEQDSPSEIAQQEYRQGAFEERNDKELTMILERSEQNNSVINTHYKNQINRQLSKNYQDQLSANNFKSQNLQSQVLSDELMKQFSSKLPQNSQNYVLNSIGGKEFYLESQIYGKNSMHPNIQNSNYQQFSFNSMSGNNQNSGTNQGSIDYQMRFLKDDSGNKELLISQKMS